MKTNKEVIRAFVIGHRAAAGNLHTDGRSLWSYNLKIAHRNIDGGIVVGDFTAPGGGFWSTTTSKHVGMAKRCEGAICVLLPELFNDLFCNKPF